MAWRRAEYASASWCKKSLGPEWPASSPIDHHPSPNLQEPPRQEERVRRAAPANENGTLRRLPPHDPARPHAREVRPLQGQGTAAAGTARAGTRGEARPARAGRAPYLLPHRRRAALPTPGRPPPRVGRPSAATARHRRPPEYPRRGLSDAPHAPFAGVAAPPARRAVPPNSGPPARRQAGETAPRRRHGAPCTAGMDLPRVEPSTRPFGGPAAITSRRGSPLPPPPSRGPVPPRTRGPPPRPLPPVRSTRAARPAGGRAPRRRRVPPLVPRGPHGTGRRVGRGDARGRVPLRGNGRRGGGVGRDGGSVTGPPTPGGGTGPAGWTTA
ncbi:hypothetical protein DFJ74DRAFT_774711, partial [Hyaloraphidium curvatum]